MKINDAVRVIDKDSRFYEMEGVVTTVSGVRDGESDENRLVGVMLMGQCYLKKHQLQVMKDVPARGGIVDPNKISPFIHTGESHIQVSPRERVRLLEKTLDVAQLSISALDFKLKEMNEAIIKLCGQCGGNGIDCSSCPMNAYREELICVPAVEDVIGATGRGGMLKK